MLNRTADTLARATPAPVARRFRGLSDKGLAWLFISPTWCCCSPSTSSRCSGRFWLSFTNFRANRPNEEIKGVGLQNYERILGDQDIWIAMQTTAHFVFLDHPVPGRCSASRLAYLLDPQIPRPRFWTTIILVPMMLSPAVVGNFWRFLYEPQIGLFAYAVSFVSGIPPTEIAMLSQRPRWRPGPSSSSILDVDALCDADLPRRSALDPRLHL